MNVRKETRKVVGGVGLRKGRQEKTDWLRIHAFQYLMRERKERSRVMAVVKSLLGHSEARLMASV